MQQLLENADTTTGKTQVDPAREARIQAVLNIDRTRKTQTPVHRIHLLKTAWFKYAAAILIMIGIGAYLWNTQKEKPAATTMNALRANNDVSAPIGNHASITLSNGQKVFADGKQIGTLAQDGGATIVKLDDGRILYKQTDASMAMQYNTLTNPRGSQVTSIVLADGTNVYLNAASSLTYPVAFTGKDRKVSITGEAYFEVAKDKTKPFIVQTRTDAITVLGTHFNINAYADEGSVRTSLIEGSVKVSGEILHPGEAYANGKVTRTNVQQDVAWKNGAFSFSNTDIETVLRQFARWYDIEVVFGKEKPNKKISGDIGRDLTLSEVIEGLNGLGVKTRIEGKKLYIN